MFATAWPYSSRRLSSDRACCCSLIDARRFTQSTVQRNGRYRKNPNHYEAAIKNPEHYAALEQKAPRERPRAPLRVRERSFELLHHFQKMIEKLGQPFHPHPEDCDDQKAGNPRRQGSV